MRHDANHGVTRDVAPLDTFRLVHGVLQRAPGLAVWNVRSVAPRRGSGDLQH